MTRFREQRACPTCQTSYGWWVIGGVPRCFTCQGRPRSETEALYCPYCKEPLKGEVLYNSMLPEEAYHRVCFDEFTQLFKPAPDYTKEHDGTCHFRYFQSLGGSKPQFDVLVLNESNQEFLRACGTRNIADAHCRDGTGGST